MRNAAEQSENNTQWEVLSEAYQYTFPLVLMDWTMKSATNREVPDLAGHAPVNQLIHSVKLADADTKLVVTPNVDTVYTQAWLNLSKEPMVFEMPETERFFQTQVLDAWTNTPVVLESGKYLIVKSGWTGQGVEGLKVIEVPTEMVWMITRILINNEADIENVRGIQNGMKLLPLSAYAAEEKYHPLKGAFKKEYEVVPIQAVFSMSLQSYFETANKLMETNPPAKADAEILERFSALKIGPGMQFDTKILKGDLSLHWKQMLSSMKKIMIDAGVRYQRALGDWTYFGSPIGNFGTAYDYRAMIALGGLGANPVEVAIYSKTDIDASGEELNGKNTYVLHFDQLPPVKEGGFWSVTAYGSDDFLIANDLERYCINDRSACSFNQDGSLDVLLSKKAPENQSNWLPVADDDFHLFLRIYLPDTEKVKSGWAAPVIRKI